MFPKLIQLDRAAVWQGLRLALAASLSFAIAVWLGVDNPYWAAMPVWVISQASRGLIYERALFRIGGTLVGAALGLAFLYLPDPYLQLACMALVVATGSALTHVLRGAHSYLPMLAGITTAVVVLPSVLAPQASFELALSRVECTLIGVLVATLISGWGTPHSRRGDFYGRVRDLAADALRLSAHYLGPEYQKDAPELSARVLAELSELDAQARLNAAGSLQAYRRIPYVDALLYAAIELLAASRVIADQRARGLSCHPEYARLLLQQADDLQAGRDLVVPGKRSGLAAREVSLARVRRAMGQIRRAGQGLFATHPPRRSHRSLAVPAVAVDWALALRTGAISGVAGFVAGALAYALNSPALELAAIGVCIFSMILGSMPRPHLMVRNIFIGVVVGACVAGLYRYAVQPHVVQDWQVIVSVLPFMLLGGLARANRPTAMPALDANMCFQLASQAGMPAVAVSAIVQGSAALIAGAAVVCAAFYVLPRRTQSRGQALVRRMVRELYPLIRRRPPRRVRAWRSRAARQLLRLLQWLGAQVPPGAVSLINLGYGMVALQRLGTQGAAQQDCVQRVCALMEGFEQRPGELARALPRLLDHDTDPALVQAVLDVVQALEGAQEILAYAYPVQDGLMSRGQA
ncbi:FUSC family protein [Alcaligenes sp. SDU_A2]|uniref:FUSC family protein n=1 Tax=Alcaligenes sp. SDU_A2 TaxID=3136634 RepID=UPI00311FFE53